jgi:hypothetical protein
MKRDWIDRKTYHTQLLNLIDQFLKNSFY